MRTPGTNAVGTLAIGAIAVAAGYTLFARDRSDERVVEVTVERADDEPLIGIVGEEKDQWISVPSSHVIRRGSDGRFDVSSLFKRH